MRTARLDVRPVVESDRDRFVAWFTDADFMVYAGPEPLTGSEAQARFDHMLAFAHEVPFAKQAVIERSSGRTLGYAGADAFEFRGETRLEFGYRLVPEGRGLGYATEASRALLDVARRVWHGELLALIVPENGASRNVLRKLGFAFIENTEFEGGPTEFYALHL
jgi:RimJ/RimL family protein N-acetyltransferase